MKIFHRTTLLTVSLIASTTFIQAPPKPKSKIIPQILKAAAAAPTTEADSGAPAQMYLDAAARTDDSPAAGAGAGAGAQTSVPVAPEISHPPLPDSGDFGHASEDTIPTPMARRGSREFNAEEKLDPRLDLNSGVALAQIKSHLAHYHYQALQNLIATHATNELVIQELRTLAARTGDFCLLFEIVRHDIHTLRNFGSSSLTAEQKQAAMINMLAHYILTLCESMVLAANLCVEESAAFAGWEIINTIYNHWFNKYLLAHAESTAEAFSREALIKTSVETCRTWFSQESDKGPSFTGIPHAVTWFAQTTRGYGLASVYTYNLAFSEDSTERKKAEIRATFRPKAVKTFNLMRLATLDAIETTLGDKTLDTLFTIEPKELSEGILGERSASPRRII
jgi:hypothetical protein